ncbi:type II toxin -antitoxin system TacA 1-like antitoxin [Actinomadura macrotermitis]|uniref:DUF1778 domain-containing protein n=1 Tax=Actinomadura macrotermitis TaxID=2585200 RepID=A0A7K0BQ34_9ACTN|nr:DUF1778 domain-containing protein [Actinomadura macrotermitis]MQY02992.1 hypothetical protein [Actinomadura macrotermitis]
MPESVRQDLPAPRPQIALDTTQEQELVLRKAAELVGWSLPQYVLCAALDRAERDLYEHAAHEEQAPAAAAEPFLAVISALG